MSGLTTPFDWIVWAYAVALSLYLPASATPFGAPPSACQYMTPGHMNAGPATPTPYTVSVSTTIWGGPIQVSVRGKYPIVGILLQARPVNEMLTSGTVGTFSNNSAGTRLMQCGSPSDSLTHAFPSNKSEVTATWTPPTLFVEPVQFVATIALGRFNWWRFVKSPQIILVSTIVPP